MLEAIIDDYWPIILGLLLTLLGLTLFRGVAVDDKLAVHELENLKFSNIQIVSRELCPFTGGCDRLDAVKFKAEIMNGEQHLTVFAYVRWPFWTSVRISTQ